MIEYTTPGDNRRYAWEDLWDATAPRDPGPLVWAQLQDEIQRGVLSAGARQRRRQRTTALFMVPMAVTLVLIMLLQPRPPAADTAGVHPANQPFYQDEEVLTLAEDADVIIERITGPGWPTLLVGDLDPIWLAEATDILIEATDSDSWPQGQPLMTRLPGEFPMIYALNEDS